MIKATFIVLLATGFCRACECTQATKQQQKETPKDDPVTIVLEKLNKTTSNLKSYQSQIEYKFIQPVFPSETLQKGVFYYARSLCVTDAKQEYHPKRCYLSIEGYSHLPHP